MSARLSLFNRLLTVLSTDRRNELLDAYRAEVLADAAPLCAVCETPIEWVDCPTGGWWAHHTHPADGHDAQPPGVPSRAEVLREAGGLADELIAGVSRTDSEAFARVDSFRAYSDRLHEIADGGAPAPAGESTQPGFFQPGRTYTDGNGFRAPETLTIFRVETVTRHPSRGTLRAIGWAKIGAAPGGTWHGYFLDEGEFKGWTEYAEGEAPRD